MAIQETGVSLNAENKARFLADMESATRAVQGFGEAAGKSANGLAKIGESSMRVGADIAKMSVAAGAAATAITTAFATKAVGAFGDFEAAILQTKSVADEWSPAIQKDIEDLALKLGADLPISAKDAALGFSELARAGFKANEITQAGAGLANLAVAGQLDMARSAEILTAALTGFQLPADQAGKVADLLAKTANASAASLDGLGETLKYVAPVAKASGASIEDVSIAMGLMANAGVEASMAGTSLRSIIQRLAAQPKGAYEALKALGVTTADATGKMRPFRDVLQDLRSKFKDLSEEQSIQLAKGIAGQEAMAGFLAIVQASPEKFDQMTQAIDNSNGAAAKMAGTLSEGFKGAVENLKGSVESFLIKAGRPLGMELTELIKNASAAVTNLAPLGEAFGTYLAKGIDTATTALSKVDWNALIEKGKPIMDTILGIASALNPLAIGIELLSGVLSGNIDKSLSNIGERFSKVGEYVNQLAPKLIENASELLQKLLTWVADNGPKIATELQKWGIKLVEWIAPEIPKLLEAGGKLLGSMTNWIVTEGVPTLATTFAKWGEELWAWVGHSWPEWSKQAGVFLDNAVKWAGEQIPVWVAEFAKWGKTLTQWVIDSLPEWLKKGGEFLTGVIDWVGKQTPAIGKKIQEWATEFTLWITRDVLPQLPGLLMQVIGTIGDFIKQNLPKIIKIGADIGGGLFQGVMRAIPGGGIVADAGQAVGEFFDPNAQRRKQLEEDYSRNRAAADRAYSQKQISVQQYQTYLTELTAAYQKQLSSIPGYATGTRHAPGGWSMVGEAGPELAYLPYGSQVVPHNMTAAQIGQMGNNYTNNYYGGNSFQASMSMPAGASPEAFQMGFEQFYLMNKRG